MQKIAFFANMKNLGFDFKLICHFLVFCTQLLLQILSFTDPNTFFLYFIALIPAFEAMKHVFAKSLQIMISLAKTVIIFSLFYFAL